MEQQTCRSLLLSFELLLRPDLVQSTCVASILRSSVSKMLQYSD